jgi:ABC-type antimicrobial peptide transport system permease subunit
MDIPMERCYTPVSLPRFRSALIGLFAAIALLLASVGIYGVTAYLVVQRTQEIGIRMALGASKANVLSLVLGHTARLAFAGAILGIAGAFALGPPLKTMLFGVSFHDPAIAMSVGLLLVLVALIATYLPAHRAAHIDPIKTLRQE